MLKKILIAAVAVVVGLVVLTKVTNISLKTLLSDCCASAKRMVPLDVRLRQLKTKIDAIDKEIEQDLVNLARKKVEVEKFEAKLKKARQEQAVLRTEIEELLKSLDGRTETVVFRGETYQADELKNRLDLKRLEYENLKQQVKLQQPQAEEQKRCYEEGKKLVLEKKNAKEKLRLLATRLETQIEVVKMKQMQTGVRSVDDSVVGECNALAEEIETALREADAEVRLRVEFGYNKKSTDKDAKTLDEVRRDAKRALRDEEPTDKIAIDKNDQ